MKLTKLIMKNFQPFGEHEQEINLSTQKITLVTGYNEITGSSNGSGKCVAKGTKIITHHKSWIYFTNRFGLIVATELEPKPGIPPGPAHLREVIKTAEKEKIKTIVVEPFYSRKAADKVALETGANVLVIANSTGGQKGIDNYIMVIDNIVNSLAKAFK